eukprot:COSAG05_NODE_6981_length_871_cov_1.107513_1_plen_186_part_10
MVPPPSPLSCIRVTRSAKYISVDGKKMSISSINFSRTSFTRNREAGAILEGRGAPWLCASQLPMTLTPGFSAFLGAQPLIAAAAGVFSDDWTQAFTFKPRRTLAGWSAYNSSVISNRSAVPVVLPTPSSTWAHYWNPPGDPQTIQVAGAGTSVTVGTSPDYASKLLMHSISQATKRLDVHIYQITS